MSEDKEGDRVGVFDVPVLIVEDDPNDVVLIRRAFEKARIVNRVEVVPNGEEAMAYLAGEGMYADRKRHPMPAIVLLDIKLPRRSGHEVLAWLRRRPGLARLPVVVLTSSSQPADVNKAYDLGANSYLVKPPSFGALTDMMRTLGMYWLARNVNPEIMAT